LVTCFRNKPYIIISITVALSLFLWPSQKNNNKQKNKKKTHKRYGSAATYFHGQDQIDDSPHDEHQSSGSRPVKLCPEQ
jgi:hypothetical protein